MKNLRILLILILFCFCFINTDYYYDSVDSTSIFDPDPSPIITTPSTPVSYIDSTIPSNKTEGNPRIILIGFENFKIEEKISFNVIFRRIYGIIPTLLKLTIHISNGISRNLEEKKNTIECSKISSENEDIIKFNCLSDTLLDNIIKVSADKEFSLVNENGEIYDGLVFLSGYANRTIENIQNEKDPIKEFIILQKSKSHVEESEKKFTVLGYIIEKEDIEDNTEVTLYVNDNVNNKIEIPCKIEKENQLNLYELECYPKKTISFNLDNVDGIIINKNLIISMDDGEDDFIHIQIQNESDKGLSTGAIVGIVIACVVVVIASALIAMLLCRKSVKTPNQDNVNQNNVTQIDSYFKVNKDSKPDLK